jgi:geranylgeranyl pyrophosphate synthase
MMQSLDAFSARVRASVERRLSELLAPADGAPARLVEAMRYAALGGGKRMRPLLVVASGEAVLSDDPPAESPVARDLLTAACAVEMIHTFSLIHDDLPALDDDSLRRGRPTLHVRFDEATAVLAGDALLNQAYEVLAAELTGPPAAALGTIAALGTAVGLRGMISGQVLDLEHETSPASGETLERIHGLKTGALIAACCDVGGQIAGAGASERARLRSFGTEIGLAFQIVDDILDVEGSAAELGKSPGKDASRNKATYPALFGIPGSRARAEAHLARAREAIAPLGRRGAHLEALAGAIVSRSR